MNQQSSICKVMIGCDPEFVIRARSRNKIVIAKMFLDFAQAGWPAGYDGSGRQLELRPRPSTSVITVIARLRALLAELVKNNPINTQVDFISGGCIEGTPMGGHIHLSAVSKAKHLWSDYRSMFDEPIIKLLNKFLYETLLGHYQNTGHINRRLIAGYGRINYEDNVARFKTKYHIEYRILPSWLVSPSFTFMSLILAKIAGLLVLNKNVWQVDINKLLSSNLKYIPYYKLLIEELSPIKDLMADEDIKLFIKLVEDNKIINTTTAKWSKDFREAWEI